MSAIIYLDLARLKKNFGIVKKIANNSKIMSVIKTNAYGHNILKVAKSLSGSDEFAVAEISEAKILRKNYIKKRIICLQGFENIKELNFCKKNTFQAVIKTTIVIIVSLLPLLFSEFKSISQLAYITIISAIVAIVFDLIYLPKLLKRYIK